MPPGQSFLTSLHGLAARLRQQWQRLRQRPNLLRTGSNIGWLLGERLGRVAIGLLVTVWVARHLGPASFGELSFAAAYAALWGAVASLGLEGVAVRDVARTPGNAGSIIGTAAMLRLGASFLVAGLGLAFLAAATAPGQQRLLLVALALGGLLFQSADVVDYWFQARLRSRLTVLAKLAALGAAAGARVALILTAAPLPAFAAVFVLEQALYAAAMAASYRRHPCPGPPRWDAGLARRMLADGLPIMVSSLAVMIYMRVDQIMLRELGGAEQLGLFSAVLPFTEGWYVIGTSVCTSLMPTFARLHGEDPQRFRRNLQRLLSALSLAGVGIALAVSLLAGPLVTLLLGPRYVEAAGVLAIHVWALVFVYLGVAENLWLVNSNRRGLRVAKTALGAVTNVGLNWLLIPALGAKGAAIATLLSFAMAAYGANLFLAPEMFRMQTRAFLLRRPA